MFLEDLQALLAELKTAIDNHDHDAAELVAQQLHELVKGHCDGN